MKLICGDCHHDKSAIEASERNTLLRMNVLIPPEFCKDSIRRSATLEQAVKDWLPKHRVAKAEYLKGPAAYIAKYKRRGSFRCNHTNTVGAVLAST